MSRIPPRFRKPEQPYRCKRVKSDMTPCYTDDGDVVLSAADTTAFKRCVGCDLTVAQITQAEGKEIKLLP